jgi:spermidine synthase
MMALCPPADHAEQPVRRVLLAAGLSSVVMQLVLVREFLAQFQGNEFTISLILFSWLILGGTGSRLALTATRRRPAQLCILVLLALLLAALAAPEILAIRLLRDSIFLHGADVGFYQTLAFVFFFTAPYAVLNGFLLPYALFVLRRDRPDFPAATVYLLDNLGDICGGLLFSFVLVLWLTPLQAVVLVNLPLFAAALLAAPGKERRRPLFLAAASGCLALLIGGTAAETASLAPLEGRLEHYAESRYGRIIVQRDREQLTIFVDGAPVFSSHNREIDEETIHFPLSQVETPRDILLIGAEGGMLEEVAKYRPRQVDYVEIDRELTAAQLRYHLLVPIPALHIIHRDGRAFLAATDRQYDAIIVNLPEPDTFQINRFYTSEFFQLARRHLRPGGIFSFSVAGFDSYLAEPARLKISSLSNSAATHFAHVQLLPGAKLFFLCRDQPMETDIPLLLEKRGIQTAFVSRYYRGNITPERLSWLQENLQAGTPANRDMAPFLLRLMLRHWLELFAASPLPFLAGIGLALLLFLCRARRGELVLFSTGFVVMGSEILVIFLYQILFGYVYEQIGLLVTVFLAGLLPGAWLGERLRQRGHCRKPLAACDTGIIMMLTLLLLGLTMAAARLPPLFLLLAGFMVSMLCGCQFPLALTLGGNDNRAAARTLSADLIGAGCGVLATSLLLIPYLGIPGTVACLLLIKTAGMLALAGEK